MDDLIDDLQIALVKAGAVKVTVDGICPLSKGEQVQEEGKMEAAASGSSVVTPPE